MRLNRAIVSRLSPLGGRTESWRRQILCGVLVMGVLSMPGGPVFGWGSQGHGHLTNGSVAHLPEPLRSFFEANKSSVSSMASQEPPGKHYIDIDYYPEFFAGTFPHDVNDLISTYGYAVVEDNGMAPWTYENYVGTLTGLMASAVTKQDWINLLPVAAAQAHYIEDMHNPLHLTQNYDGQFTGNGGIHSRYETQMVNRHLNDLTFSTAPAVYLPSVIEDVFAGIDVHYYFVDDIMAADDAAVAVAGSYNTAYYNELWNQTGTFTQGLFEEAAQAVANGWYTAWVNAGSPIPNLGLAGDYNGNNVIDAADYTVWRDAMSASSTVLLNDPTPGTVNDADFTYWRSHFGATIGGGAGAGGASAAAVPEQASGLLLLVGVAATLACRRALL
jgi:hypothetical protein